MPQFSKDELIALAKTKAAAYSLDPAIVCAVVDGESSWWTYSQRFEPKFYAKYVAKSYPAGLDTESVSRATSFGLMQIIGETARELGYDAVALSGLCEPSMGLEYGCKLLKNKLDAAKGDYSKALLAFNGGAAKNYPDYILGKVAKYK